MMVLRALSSLFVAQSGLQRGKGFASFRTTTAFACSMSTSHYAIAGNSIADVHLVPMFNDNYGFIIVDKATKTTACVDPGDGSAMIKALKTLDLNLDMILCTHKHADHVGGNFQIKEAFPSIQIVGTKYEAVPGITRSVGDGDQFDLGSLQVSVHHTPCHTHGHVVFLLRSSIDSSIDSSSVNGSIVDSSNSDSIKRAPLLFCGDTLFVGGCGRFFEGTAEEMLKNMDFLSSLPPQTQVYCAHEYTESNMKFLAHIDPEISGPVLQQVQQQRAQGKFTVPSTIGQQLQYNLFIKCREPRTQQLTGTTTAVDAMATLRSMKNNF